MREEVKQWSAAARLLARRVEELGKVSDEAGRLTRTFLSPAMARANALVAEWMRGAGMTVREDAVGNVIGRVEGERPDAKTLLLGSHLDTVRNAGKFDGALGVVLPIVALEVLRAEGVRLPFAVEVIGFSEEEAVRFPAAYIGSKAYTGRLGASDLKLSDANGRTLRGVLEERVGGRFERPRAAHRGRDLLGYVEVHIEQGPVLEAEGLAVGVVSAIASQTRGRLRFRGKAGHAGTTPMGLRKDALAGAAELVLFAEKFARERAPLVATVGTIAVPGGATNVIPGEVALSLDVRHPSDARCARAVEALVREAKKIAAARGLECAWEQTMQSPATPCARGLMKRLEESVAAVQGRSLELVSGAGHDAVAMAKVAPVAMLFVRCRDGLSHHPDEYASAEDMGVALRVVVDFLREMR
jgi:amidase, hydantoinase/carbamoylase family